MDDTNQSVVQNTQNLTVGQQGVVQQSKNTNTSVQSHNSIQQPNQPVSVGLKEQAPVASVASTTVELIKPSTPEVVVPQELKEHMEATPQPNVPQDVGNLGVKLAKEETPVSIPTEEETLGLNTHPVVLAKIKLAHKGVKDSIRWFAELIGLAQKKRDYDIAHPTDMALQYPTNADTKNTEKKEKAA